MSDSLPTVTTEREWAAFAAIDWADQKHFWRLVPAGSQHAEQGELENTPEAVEAWATTLQQRFGGRPIAFCNHLGDLLGVGFAKWRLRQPSVLPQVSRGPQMVHCAAGLNSAPPRCID